MHLLFVQYSTVTKYHKRELKKRAQTHQIKTEKELLTFKKEMNKLTNELIKSSEPKKQVNQFIF